ncbi:unnamed protein product, partial [Meganyctiphanes norvegica]
ANLINHHRTHTEEKLYQCSQCDKAFSRKNNLIEHQIKHTGDEPNQCNQCDKAFSHRSSHLQHQMTPSDRIQRNNTKIPQKDVIDDPEGHFVVALDKRGMCAVKGCYSRPIFYCIKCQIYLCLSTKKNCFAKFHGVNLESANIPH